MSTGHVGKFGKLPREISCLPEEQTISQSTFIYRIVAQELANEEEQEVLGILHDVQGFLKRPEGLPTYISKSELFIELVKIWKNPSVCPEKKVEAIDTSGLLLKIISGKKNRKKNSHSNSDVANCLDIVLPTAICQLTSKVRLFPKAVFL